ncbi:hypothetical protein FBZ96_1021112 [Bradyrhizobium stylosanthis]|uniref:DUF1134 domain-containing protein n=1 Tax=Bradyrhizobium stylosanthis TaxID=1803665 RepID=A0A560E5I5_9BRAD|nr:hypothetical protein [Bradyrhizobium stylosanthis]TWB04632.1 hypothetical protein FBZ96_1021112 [Bradyrhizobium stylosanthis]
MPRSLSVRSLRTIAASVAALVLVLLAIPATPAFAQASGEVRVKIVKAGLLVGGGAGSGVLTYRGRNYPFNVAGLSFGITAGASVGRFEGRASGIREVSDFAGTYSSVGGGFALVGGVNGVQLRNEKGVTLTLQGPKAGLELAANIGQITIALK